MKYLFTLLVLWGLGSTVLLAQSLQPEVYSSAGFSDSGYQSWTIGEPMVETFNPGGTVQLTQGFHQPKIVVVAVPEPGPSIGVKVFPVPAGTEVFLAFDGESLTDCEIELTSMAGQVLARKHFVQVPEQTSFDLTDVSAGIYLIKVYWKQRQEQQLFRIEKINF